MKDKFCLYTLVALIIASIMAPFALPVEARGGGGHGGGGGGYHGGGSYGGGGRSFGGGGSVHYSAPARSSYTYSARPSYNYNSRSTTTYSRPSYNSSRSTYTYNSRPSYNTVINNKIYSNRPLYSHNVYNYNVYGTSSWHNGARAGLYGNRVWNGSRWSGRVSPVRIYETNVYAGVPGIYGGYFYNNGGYYGVPYSSWYSGCPAGWYGGRYWYGDRWADVAALSILAGLELTGVIDHGIGYYQYNNWSYGSPAGIYDNYYWTGSDWYGSNNAWYYGCPEGWYNGRYWRADGRWATAQEIALLISMLLQ